MLRSSIAKESSWYGEGEEKGWERGWLPQSEETKEPLPKLATLKELDPTNTKPLLSRLDHKLCGQLWLQGTRYPANSRTESKVITLYIHIKERLTSTERTWANWVLFWHYTIFIVQNLWGKARCTLCLVLIFSLIGTASMHFMFINYVQLFLYYIFALLNLYSM